MWIVKCFLLLRAVKFEDNLLEVWCYYILFFNLHQGKRLLVAFSYKLWVILFTLLTSIHPSPSLPVDHLHPYYTLQPLKCPSNFISHMLCCLLHAFEGPILWISRPFSHSLTSTHTHSRINMQIWKLESETHIGQRKWYLSSWAWDTSVNLIFSISIHFLKFP